MLLAIKITLVNFDNKSEETYKINVLDKKINKL